ncbi:hypothetical protein BKI52_26580 [marine bacterium AO1-C]|nr:hypothetical protein BKI52_26580 [marine bacterium AO1-C]
MAEDNPTNSDSEKDPLHDPFDMLSGNTPPPEKPEDKKEETTPSTGSTDPFDMVEKHDTPGTSTPPPTTPANTGGTDPFDMVEKHDTPGTSTPPPTTPANTGGTDPFDMVEKPSTPGTTTPGTTELPKPSEDPLLATNPATPPATPTPNTPGTPTPPVTNTPTPQPIPTPTPTPQPTTTTPIVNKEEPTREAYESKINLDAVIAAANQGRHVPDIELSDMENLDKKLFQKTARQKSSPDERAEAEKKLKYLEDKIKKDLQYYERKEKKSGKGTLVFSVLSSLLAASVTVLLGLNITDFMRKHNVDWYINTVALVISAFISVIGVVQNFTDSKPLWIKYTDAINQYQHLLDNIEFMRLAGEYITLEDVTDIKLAYNKIKSGTNNYIIQVRSQDDGGPTNMLRT